MDYCLLTDGLPRQVPGTRYEIADCDWRWMVRFEARMLRARTPQDAEQPIQGALLQVFGPSWCRQGCDVASGFEALLWYYRGPRGESAAADAPAPRRPLAYDYVIDGPLIAAAFQQVYGIDLTDPAVRFHWWRFQALMQGLPEGCQFSQVVAWRTADLSGMKGEQRKLYAKMQAQFALPPDLGKGEKRVYASKADWDAAFIERLRKQAGKK